MDIQSVLQKMLPDQIGRSNNMMEFKPGQVFYGTVQKLYPNQLAEIQIRSKKFIAKLEVPMSAGKGYWLEVSSGGDDPKLRLASPESGSKGFGAPFLQQLSLPNHKSSHALVSFLMKEQLPMSKLDIVKAASFLKDTVDLPSGLLTIKTMSEHRYPFNQAIYQSLLQTGTTDTLMDMMSAVRTALTAEPNPSPINTILLEKLAPFQLDMKALQGRQVFERLMHIAAEGQEGSKQTAASILDKLGIDHSGPVSNKTALMKLAEYANAGARNSPGTAETVVNSLDDRLLPHERQMVKEVANGSLERVLGRDDALRILTGALERTGLFYERALLDSNNDLKHFADNVKALLIRYLQESGDSSNQQTREAVQNLLYKMNGQQLLSVETGPIQQIFFEIPLKLFGHETNMTMQWSGKKTEEGKINPDFCRIIFYLELEHLKSTIVDMHVQNRIVGVHIINESEQMKYLSDPLLPALRAGLEKMDYSLSAVHFKRPAIHEGREKKKSPYFSDSGYRGVDYRI